MQFPSLTAEPACGLAQRGVTQNENANVGLGIAYGGKGLVTRQTTRPAMSTTMIADAVRMPRLDRSRRAAFGKRQWPTMTDLYTRGGEVSNDGASTILHQIARRAALHGHLDLKSFGGSHVG
jgi:hypothetical protein